MRGRVGWGPSDGWGLGILASDLVIPVAIRRLAAALCVAVAAIPFAVSLPVEAETPAVPLAQNGPAPCTNLPLSSAELQPTSCWVTGPTSIVVAGVDVRNAADGAVYVVDGQKKRRTDLPGAGRLTIASVSGSMACLRDAAGHFTGIDRTDGTPTSGCGATSASSTPRGGVKAACTPGLLPLGSTRYQPYPGRSTTASPCRENACPSSSRAIEHFSTCIT